MAKHGVLHEVDAQFIAQCINKAGVATIDIDGGALVAVGALDATDKELYTLTAPTATASRVAVAFNPSVKYDEINGKLFPASSLDDRDYTNPAGKVVDFFYPEVGVVFGVQGANIEGSTAPTVGKFLEPTASKTTYSIKSSQTSGVASFKVIDIINVTYPTGDFTEDAEPIYVVETVAN